MYLVETGGATDFGSEITKMGEPGEPKQERRTRYGRNVGLAGLPAGLGVGSWDIARRRAVKAGKPVKAAETLTHARLTGASNNLFYGGAGIALGAEGARRFMRRRRWKKELRGQG